MKFKFAGKRISGITAVVPHQVYLFDDEIHQYPHPPDRTRKLKEVMGYDRHRLVDANVCTSDLIYAGMQHLYAQGRIRPEEIDALIVVTQSPDYAIPPTSSVLHGRLGLKDEALCFDLNQGCAGYILGLMQAFLLLDQPNIAKVIVAVGDTLSHRTSRQDRNSFPLIGDAAAVTLVERGDASPIHLMLRNRGSGSDALMIPAGGFRKPSTDETRTPRTASDGNIRSEEHLTMQGSEVFNFTQTVVPEFIQELCSFADTPTMDVNRFFLHQANSFIVKKIADKLGVPREKVPDDVVRLYGNSSSATIPVEMVHHINEQKFDYSSAVCLCGFGVGLAWGGLITKLEPFRFCDMIEY